MKDKSLHNELFRNELEVLESALEDIGNHEFADNQLLGKYRDLALSYQKLLKLSGKIFNISDTQGKELKRRVSEIKVLLDNSNQGFLTFGRNFLINKEYSTECIRIFGKKIGGCNIIELLAECGTEQMAVFKEVFESIFFMEDQGRQLSMFKTLPSMLQIGDNYINIKYKMINYDEMDAKDDTIMLVLTDITEKRKAEDQVFYLSYHDKLTSLYNRAYIESLIPQLQIDSKMPLSVILADMNGLKLTNDVFGHICGDELLVSAAKIFLSCSRKSDIVARWGGDEFIIILPNADHSTCKMVSERIKEMCIKTAPNPIQISIALGYATMESPKTSLTELLSVAENIMYSNKISESREVRSKIILSLEKTLHTKCFEDIGHIERLKKMSAKFAEILGLKPDSTEMVTLQMLAAFHDIGKVAIPREILGKLGGLTENEWKIMKSHTEIGFRMAQSIDEPALAQAILAFRERWDGTGYPYGIAKEQIPYITRIIAIVDAFDVMTHDRPYRPAYSRQEAELELKKCSGTQFDPQLVDQFLNHLDRIIQ